MAVTFNKTLTRIRPQTLLLLIGPLIGGVITHLFDLALLSRYYSYSIFSGDAAQDFIYAAEVAPQLLLRHKRSVRLDTSDDAWSDGIDRLPKLDFDEEWYEKHKSPDEGECISMHSWQERSFPVCNSIHEMDFFSKFRPDGDVTLITNGGFNNLYHYKEHVANSTAREYATTTSLALKILKYEKDYTQHKFGVVRQDSVTLERLTKSSHIYPIYAYCGFAMIVPFFTGGNLDDKLWDWNKGKIHISSRERLQYAVDVARGLRDLHDIDGDGVPSATHGDLKEHQYLFGEDGRLILGDFNKGQFLSKSSTSGKPCTYKPPSSTYNDKVFRSPEEYKNIQQTAATDVYAMGSLIYYLLTGHPAWDGMHNSKGQKKARRYIIEGKRPEIDKKILKSKDPVDVALLEVYNMCTQYEPEKRANAVQVADYLDRV